jgi:ABC-type multidrug transport system fused ATPase/permease subunit
LQKSKGSLPSQEKAKCQKKKYSSSFGLFKYLKPYAFIFSLGLLLLVISGLLVIVITALLGFLMSPTGQGAIPGGAMSQQILKMFHWNGESATSQTLFVLVGLLIIQGVFSFFRVYIFAYVTENAMFQLRKDTFSKLIRMPMQFYNEKRVGDLSSRLTSDITAIQETLTTTLAEFLRQSVIIVVGVGWLVAYSPYLTLVMLASLPVIIVILVFFGRFIKKLSKETQDKVAEAGVVINESFTSITSVKGFSNEPYESSRFTEKISFVKQFAMKSAVWRGMFGTFIIIFLFGALGLVIGVGAYLQQSGELSADILPQFIMLTGLVAGSIGGLAAQMGSLQRSFGIIDSVMEILSMESEDLPNESTNTPKLRGGIEFKDISFAYPSRPESLILNQISLTIKPGQQVALVGSSGSGKSTIANLALRFYNVLQGEILFDGESANNRSLRDIRNNMAYVPQEVLLFGGTIYENIRYGNPMATEAEVFEAAKKANAFEFISNFPEKFQTIVGERGIQLSGGQRQRIAIARAILKNPAILILDEATSALDSENEKLVQQALNELMQNRTSIVIAHRLSTIRQADCIYVIEEGRILEFGTHQELLNKNGAYKRMLDIQEQMN